MYEAYRAEYLIAEKIDNLKRCNLLWDILLSNEVVVEIEEMKDICGS